MDKTMTPAELEALAGRIRALTGDFRRDADTHKVIERLARQDLAAANAMWHENASTAVRSEAYSKPAVLQVGTIVANQYEKATYQRAGREFLAETGAELYIKHAQADNEYVGSVVGRTDRFMIQREAGTGDYVLHQRKQLAGAQLGYDDAPIKVTYPAPFGRQGHAAGALDNSSASGPRAIGLVGLANLDESMSLSKTLEMER